MTNTQTTINYYNTQASSFAEGTVNVEFSELQNAFCSQIREGSRILDLGCGSGRDSKVFLDRGYQVTAIDGSEELCKIASDFTGISVIHTTFQEFVPEGKYDGIWACASLLHLEFEEIKSVMKKMAEYLNENGCFYASFKYGDFAGERNGRYFTDLTETSFEEILKEIPNLRLSNQHITTDVRPGREEKWLNVFLVKNNLNLSIKPLTKDLMADYLDFFDHRAFTDDNPNGPCYCTSPNQDEATIKRMVDDFKTGGVKETLRKYAIEMLIENKIQGYLAYDGDLSIGWCNAADICSYDSFVPEAAKQLVRGKTISIVCFEIAPQYRNMGIALELIKRVCEDAKTNGYEFVEGYAKIDKERDNFDFYGPFRLYEKAGFQKAEVLDEQVIMRREI